MIVPIPTFCSRCGYTKGEIKEWFADGECCGITKVWRVCKKCGYMQDITEATKKANPELVVKSD